MASSFFSLFDNGRNDYCGVFDEVFSSSLFPSKTETEKKRHVAPTRKRCIFKVRACAGALRSLATIEKRKTKEEQAKLRVREKKEKKAAEFFPKGLRQALTFSGERGSLFILSLYAVSFSSMSAPLRQPAAGGEAVFSVDDPAFSTDEFRMFRVRLFFSEDEGAKIR